MENRPMNDEKWVEERLRALNPGIDWRPNAGAAFAGLQRKDRRRVWQVRSVWSMAMAAAFAVVIVALPSPAKCALVGVGCKRPLTTPVLLAPAVAANPPLVVNYKESG